MNATPWPSSWSRQEAWPPRVPWTSWTSSPPASTREFQSSWDPLMMSRNTSQSIRSTTNEVLGSALWQSIVQQSSNKLCFFPTYFTGEATQNLQRLQEPDSLNCTDNRTRKLPRPTTDILWYSIPVWDIMCFINKDKWKVVVKSACVQVESPDGRTFWIEQRRNAHSHLFTLFF